MIYLDNAATSMPKPQAVTDAVSWAMKHCASVGRGNYEAARLAAEITYDCRTLAGQLFALPPERVVFTMNATHGLNLAIRTLVHSGDTVVISGFEHHAVTRTLHHLGIQIRVAGTTLFDREELLRAFEDAITPDVRAVVCTHVSNVFGYTLPVKEIADLCRERQVPLILDAAQSAGVLPISMEQLRAAFVAMPGHKGLYGPQGTGLLLCGQTPDPLLLGGTGSLSRSYEMPTFLPDRMEAGTHNVPGIAGLLEGLRFVQRTGYEEICRHEQDLAKKAVSKLKELPDVEVFSGPGQMGVVSFRTTQDCEEIAGKLGQDGIAVRAGLHCAPLAHKSAKTLETGTIRVSFSLFNKEDDVEQLIFSLRKMMIPGNFSV